jgi:hypothetical protein
MNEKKLNQLIDQAFGVEQKSWSANLQQTFKPFESFYRRTQRDIELKFPDVIQWYKENLASFVKSLAEDMLEHLEKGDYPSVYQQYQQFMNFAELMKKLRIKKLIKNELRSIRKNVIPTLLKLEKTHEKTTVFFPLKLAHLPVGVYHFKSIRGRCEFHLNLKVYLEEGKTCVRYHLKGLPLAADQWKDASADTHPAIKKFVEEEILKKKYQHDYLVLS